MNWGRVKSIDYSFFDKKEEEQERSLYHDIDNPKLNEADLGLFNCHKVITSLNMKIGPFDIEIRSSNNLNMRKVVLGTFSGILVQFPNMLIPKPLAPPILKDIILLRDTEEINIYKANKENTVDKNDISFIDYCVKNKNKSRGICLIFNTLNNKDSWRDVKLILNPASKDENVYLNLTIKKGGIPI